MNEGEAVSVLAGVVQKIIRTVSGQEGKVRIFDGKVLGVLVEVVVK